MRGISSRGNTKLITGHSNDKVINDNYIDEKEKAKVVARRFGGVFFTEEERNIGLIEIRTAIKNNTQQKNLEV